MDMLKKLFHVCFSSEDRAGRGPSARQTNEGIQTNVRALYDDNKRLHSALPVPVFDGQVSTPAPFPYMFGMVASNPFIFLDAGSSGRAATAPWFSAT